VPVWVSVAILVLLALPLLWVMNRMD